MDPHNRGVEQFFEAIETDIETENSVPNSSHGIGKNNMATHIATSQQSSDMNSPLISGSVKRKCTLSPLDRTCVDTDVNTSKLIEGIEPSFKEHVNAFQTNTHEHFDRTITKLTKTFDEKMDLKAKEITESFTINLGEITSKFEHERQERIKLRDELDILKAQVREANTAGDTTVTSACKIVIKRLPIKPDDDNATTLTMVHAVLTEVDPMYRFTITDMHRVPGTRDRGVPPIIITMEDESQVKHIMKNKRVLAQSSSFTRVYIEPDKARDQR